MSFADIVPDLKSRAPKLRGRLLPNQSLAELTWFRVGGPAQVLFMPDDEADLSYFLGVLTSVAVHTASRPYWARSNSAPFSDFGSTVGNDAGVKLLHEFGPGIRQMVTGHMPEFVSRIEERIIRDQTPSEVASIPAR